jgi:hypothetical protein
MRKDVESALSKASLGIVIVAVAGMAFFLFTLWRWGHFVTSTIKYVVENLASHSGLSTNLLYGIVIIATIPFFWAVGKYMHGAWFWLRGVGPSLRLYKSIYGIIIVVYVGMYFLAMYFVARNSLAYKYCAVTPEGISVFDDRVKDPVYGIQAESCTLDQMVVIRRTKNPSLGPQRVQVGDARTFAFFEPVTGHARIWYYKTSAGEYEFFDRMGNDPETGASLKEMDQQAREDAIRVQEQRAATAQQAEQRRAAAAQQAEQQRATANQQRIVAEQQRGREVLAEKYVNTGVAKRAGDKQAAILVFSNEHGQFAGIEETLDHAASSRGLTPVGFFFKPQFVQEGRAERLFSGDWGEATQLGIGDRVDVVIIGRATISATDSTQFENLVTTNLSLELKCLNVAHQAVCGSKDINAVGAGYNKAASLQNASEKARLGIDAFVKALRID